ncbi:MAG: 2-amino-4-hydroxy-6-hydroxymethyldihydropteridine diphosphokinase [Planctomycetota bacterium]
MAEPVPAAIGIGANLGDREAALSWAVQSLGHVEGVRVLKIAAAVETPAMVLPGSDETQPDFLNTVALVETTLDPLALLRVLQRMELAYGRPRLTGRERWAARVLDLDLLLYGDTVVAEEGLTVPHPGLAERWFVLKPLSEIAPDWVVPGLDQTVRELLAGVSCG